MSLIMSLYNVLATSAQGQNYGHVRRCDNVQAMVVRTSLGVYKKTSCGRNGTTLWQREPRRLNDVVTTLHCLLGIHAEVIHFGVLHYE